MVRICKIRHIYKRFLRLIAAFKQTFPVAKSAKSFLLTCRTMVNVMVFNFVRILLKITFSVIFISLSLICVPAQKPGDDIIKIDTDLITFEATVTDVQGKPVRGLKPLDFKIFEDGMERPVAFFEQQKRENFERPLSVVFALDVSGSMTHEELLKLRSALSVFSNRLANSESYFSVMSFGMEVKTLQSFTNNSEKLEKSFDKLLREGDGLSTHAYDAVDDAVRMLNKKAPKTNLKKVPMRKVVILVTDGFPVGDTVAPATVVERANSAEVSVFNVIMPSYSRRQMGNKPLPTPLDVSGISDKTGGSSFYLTGDNFDAMFGKLAEEITSTYLLAFYPDETKRSDGQFHQVKIETSKGLQLKQNRAGYTAPKEKGN
jgi:VWFA-related protein